jgi:thioester reductase-like protein
MKTILVIAASGFIGRHLTKALLAKGYAIRCRSGQFCLSRFYPFDRRWSGR